MSMTDPIADMLTRMRNAIMARQELTDMPYSTMKFSIAKLLKEEGYLKNYKIYTDEARKKFIKVYLNYDEHNRSVISGLRRISKPGRRVYIGREEIPDVLGGMGIAILSTSRGVLDGRSARQLGIGGEWICSIW